MQRQTLEQTTDQMHLSDLERLLNPYLGQVAQGLQGVPDAEKERLLGLARARVELDLELNPSVSEAGVQASLARVGDPSVLAAQLRAEAVLPGEAAAKASPLTACRSCRHEVSRDAQACPHCGAPFPARQNWAGRGYEYRSPQTLWGLPVLHVAYGRNAEGKLRVAKGIVAIGQFAVGGVAIAQFAAGAVFALGQFAVAPIAVGQFALGLVAVGQFGLGLLAGVGMIASGLWTKALVSLKH